MLKVARGTIVRRQMGLLWAVKYDDLNHIHAACAGHSTMVANEVEECVIEFDT